MKDVANAANVSISTVSRVLNRPHLVNEETRLRVQEAIEALQFSPSAIARSLRTKKTGIYAIAAGRGTRVLEELKTVCKYLNEQGLIACVFFEDSLGLIRSIACDGVIAVGELNKKEEETLREMSVQVSFGFPELSPSS